MTIRRIATLGVLLGVLASGCFFYDSTWGQTTKAQKRAAKHYTPELSRSKTSNGDGALHDRAAAVRTLRARVHVARGYVVETVHAEKRFQEVVDRANETLTSQLGVRIGVATSTPWQVTEEGAGLKALLEALRTTDVGDDADLVIGLAGSLPRLVFSFHELGMADMPGKHLVLRASNDALEYEALRKALDELDEKERSKVYRARSIHRATTVLLHEIGHGLGSPHSRDSTDIMFSSYAVAQSGFAVETRSLLDAALKAAGGSDAARRQAIAAALRATRSEHWVPEEREHALAQHERLAQAQPPPAATQQSAVPEPSVSPALEPHDQELYRKVLAEYHAGRLRQAFALGQPLFERYPEDRNVQDLRCQIALKGMSWQAARGECEPLMRLQPRPR